MRVYNPSQFEVLLFAKAGIMNYVYVGSTRERVYDATVTLPGFLDWRFCAVSHRIWG